ncbi:MAG: YIP1 family protein [Anaerolineae bacterium]
MNTAPRYAWTDVWTMALMRPMPETYKALLEDPHHQPLRSLRWMFLTGLVLAVITQNAIFNNPAFQAQLMEVAAQGGANVSPSEVNQLLLLMTLCATPFAAIFNVMIYVALTILIHWVARIINPDLTRDDLRRLLYVVGAVVAPLTVISAVVFILPTAISALLSLAVLVFQTYLFVQVVRGVYNLPTQQALIAGIVPTLALYGLQWLVLGSLF